MRKVITFIFITVTYAFMFSCRLISLSDGYVEEDIERDDELFCEQENGVTRFLVSDEKYKNNGRGSTLWCVKDNNERDVYECYIQKQSGDKEAGFGIVFCVSEKEDGKNYMLVLMLNMQGKYQIGKACDGEYKAKTEWQSSSNLNVDSSGNLIGIKKEGAEFVISFNSVVETRFTDEDEPSLISGGMGYIAVISPYEKFPEKSVEIYYKMQ